MFNNDLVLSRWRYPDGAAFTDMAGGATAGVGRIEEIMSPRIFRFGARFSF